MTRPLTGALAAGLLVAGGLVACAPTATPVTLEQGLILCAPDATHAEGVFGLEVRNDSESAAALAGYGIPGGDYLRVFEAWYVPHDPDESHPAYGLEPWPVDEQLHPDWVERIDMRGARLEPGDSGQLVFHYALELPDRSGSLRGLHLSATQFDPPFSVETTSVADLRLDVVREPDTCPVEPPPSDGTVRQPRDASAVS